jgi:DNA-binding transcriptional MocR family regulator
VRLGADGLDVADLDAKAACGAKALLTIPTGQNPTGTDATNLRDVYAVAARHDLWIVEDDPYYYTHFADPPPASPSSLSIAIAPRPSLLRHDVDGRVVRLDSFSKWMAPGLRCGWLTAAPPVVAKIAPLLAFASTLSQALLARTLSAWGDEGLAARLAALRARYRAQWALMESLLRAHVADLCDWTPPQSGMFAWLAVVAGPWAKPLATDPAAAERLVAAMATHGVSVVPGCFFDADGAPVARLRISFATTTEAQMREGVMRLRALLCDDDAQAGKM